MIEPRIVTLTEFIRRPAITLDRLTALGSEARLTISVHHNPIGVLCHPRPRRTLVEADCLGVSEIQPNCARITRSMWANGLLHIMRDNKRVADIYGSLHPDLVIDLQGEP